MDKISIVRVGAYSIRPTNGYTNGRMDGKIDRVSVRFYPMNQKSDRDWIYSATGVAVRRAYAIRPYPAGRKFIGFFGSFLSRESKIGSGLISFGLWRGRLWGVCNTPLPYRRKIHQGFDSFLSDE